MKQPKNIEFIQSLIRLTIGILTYTYISSGINSGYFDAHHNTLLNFTLIFFGFSFIIMLSLIWAPEHTPRRYLCLAFDVASTTFSAYLTGGIDSVFVLIYLWIYIGYGTRYGKQFLVAAVAMTLVGYNILLITEDAWTMLTLDALAFLTLIIALPVYLYYLQKRLQTAVDEAQSANRAKSEFLSTMTHQIRTPIGGVVGMIDLLSNTSLDAQQKQYLQALSQSSNSLQEVIEDIVDFSRIEKGNISFVQQSFQPRLLINSLIHSLAPLAHEKNINLNCYINQPFPHNVLGDAQRLRQLLSNLIRHAIEQSNQPGIYIQARASKISDNDHINVKISIAFSPPSNVERIYAHDLPASENALTLTVGSQLTRLMDGTFDIQYPDKNTAKFILNFNWRRQQEKQNKNSILFNDKRILIFEPDEINRQILEKYCTQLNIESYSTGGKNNLLAHILWSRKKHRLFDAIILCETLKQNTTHELIKRIRHETQCQAAIIYATYIQSIELTDAVIMPDIKANMIKPISLEDLSATLQQVFNETPLSEDDSKTQPRQKKILLAEDSEINASIVYSYLTDMGHSVDVATDGNTALYAMHKHVYDIVFMDISMPKMDGLEATRQWRKLEPEHRSLAIVALTAKATSEDKKNCMAAGMDGFMTKPVNARQLQQAIDKYCRQDSQAVGH
jgi:two-component system sensor histidine kinase RpfC